jgi:hypothetical protein
MPAARRSRRRRGNGHALTPESQISMSVTQIIIVIGFVATCAVAWGVVVWGQHSQGDDIAETKTAITAIKNTVGAVTTDQDQKREQLGKEFLASQEKIVEKVSELNTALAVQQTTSKQMNDTLVTISNELQEFNSGKRR